MKLFKTHQEYLIRLYFKYLLIIIGVFICLTFVLNILEEIKFFNQLNLSIYYPLLFTLLNLPSVIFEIFPFIFLITTQMFFLHLYDRDEIIIFKNYGVKNSDIIKIISYITFGFGIFLIFGFYTVSSNLKNNYLSFKNKFTDDNKYLAVINEDGLWIKDEINNVVSIVNAEEIENNYLKNVSISKLDKNYKLLQNISAERIDINSKIWIAENVKIFETSGKKFNEKNMLIESNFDIEKINNLFSNLSSLNIYQLRKLFSDYKSLGYSTLDIESYINKLAALPIYLVIMILIGSILMLNTQYNKSKIFNIVIGILLSVSIYYINYFFNIMGTNERIPVTLSVWFPMIILIMFSIIGLLKIDEK